MNNIIPYLRRQKGLKQNDMAEALSVSPSYLCKIETGVQEPAESFKKACADFFGLPEDEIFYAKKVKKNKIDNIKVDYKNQVWVIRKNKGLKQFELAKMLNCSPSYLSKVEKGLQRPNSEFKKKCAKILRKRESDLFPTNID